MSNSSPDSSTDASLVRSSEGLLKHKGDILSANSKKTSLNSPEGNQSSGKRRHNLRVYVLNMRGKPLMPTTPGKADRLLKANKAKVVSVKPFTIQLLYATGETKQDVILGIDIGFKNVGYSAITEKKEMISGEVKLRTDISKRLKERAMYRRNRRNQLWRRKPKNLKGMQSMKKGKGWIPPSLQHKVESHIRIIEKIKKILPITKIVIEVAKFDIQKILNPEISGEQYQQGQMYGYENVKEFVRFRDKYKCSVCGKKNNLEVHHIIPRKDGGSDRPDNLITLCHSCHQKVHQNKIKLKNKKPREYKETQLNTLVRKLEERIDFVKTYGYITKIKRKQLGILKSHNNDAFLIAGGKNQERSVVFHNQQVRRNNRKLQQNRKGFKPTIRRQRYKIQPHDIIKYNNKKYEVKGVQNYGKYIRFGNKEENYVKNINYVELLYYGKGIQIGG